MPCDARRSRASRAPRRRPPDPGSARRGSRPSSAPRRAAAAHTPGSRTRGPRPRGPTRCAAAPCRDLGSNAGAARAALRRLPTPGARHVDLAQSPDARRPRPRPRLRGRRARRGRRPSGEVGLYLLKGEQFRTVDARVADGPGRAPATVRYLLARPAQGRARAGLRHAIPRGCRLVSARVDAPPRRAVLAFNRRCAATREVSALARGRREDLRRAPRAGGLHGDGADRRQDVEIGSRGARR